MYKNYCKYYKKQAFAKINGNSLAPYLTGEVRFQDVPCGVMVFVNIHGLPPYQPAKGNIPPIGPHGFHIHDIGECTIENEDNPFISAGGHYNPNNQHHGNHAVDFPVLFSNNGSAIMTFFTNKLKVNNIIGKSVIIHQNPDDYRTQPTGASGKRIGCGIIYPIPN